MRIPHYDRLVPLSVHKLRRTAIECIPCLPIKRCCRPLPPSFLDLAVFEEIIIIILKVVCLFAWTVIFGQLLAALTQADPDRMRYLSDLDSINTFCERHRLSAELTLEVRRYFFQTLSINYAESRSAALRKLSVRRIRPFLCFFHASYP